MNGRNMIDIYICNHSLARAIPFKLRFYVDVSNMARGLNFDLESSSTSILCVCQQCFGEPGHLLDNALLIYNVLHFVFNIDHSLLSFVSLKW